MFLENGASLNFFGQVPPRGDIEASYFRCLERRKFGFKLGFVINRKGRLNLAREDQAHEDIIKGHRGRLAAGEWFTARVSACGLFHIAYLSAPDMLKSELRSIYSQLCQDDMPMVRRVAATNLGKLAATAEAAHLKTDIMSMFEDLTQDDQDYVRLLDVEGCAALRKLLEPQDCVAHILPVIVSFSQDKSWRVRYMVANQLYELCEAVGPEPTRHIPRVSSSIPNNSLSINQRSTSGSNNNNDMTSQPKQLNPKAPRSAKELYNIRSSQEHQEQKH
ncbi:hypothetical protein OROHE_016826 [Orobanche hederae]